MEIINGLLIRNFSKMSTFFKSLGTFIMSVKDDYSYQKIWFKTIEKFYTIPIIVEQAVLAVKSSLMSTREAEVNFGVTT